MGHRFRICIYNEPILREKGSLVKNHQDPAFRDFAQKLIEHFTEDNTVIGIAAQHVGHALQLAIVDLKDSVNSLDETITVTLDGKIIPVQSLFPLIITNPILTPTDNQKTLLTEYTMSLPGIPVPILRPENIKLNYQDINGISHELLCNGLLSKCIQQEVDHINGILTIDHAQPNVINALNSKLKRLKRDTRDFLKNTKVDYVKYNT